MNQVKKPGLSKENLSPLKEKPDHKKPTYTNLEYLTQRTKSNKVLMMEMINLYLEQTPPLIIAMKKGLLDRDWPLLYGAVHKMIPSFLIMGIHTDYESMAKKVQDFAGSVQHPDDISDLVLQLENVCTQACLELTESYNSMKSITHEKRKHIPFPG